jgi:hypothetical protein
MDKIKAKVIEGLEKIGSTVHGGCDSCLGVKTIVIAVLMLLIVIG